MRITITSHNHLDHVNPDFDLSGSVYSCVDDWNIGDSHIRFLIIFHPCEVILLPKQPEIDQITQKWNIRIDQDVLGEFEESNRALRIVALDCSENGAKEFDNEAKRKAGRKNKSHQLPKDCFIESSILLFVANSRQTNAPILTQTTRTRWRQNHVPHNQKAVSF